MNKKIFAFVVIIGLFAFSLVCNLIQAVTYQNTTNEIKKLTVEIREMKQDNVEAIAYFMNASWTIIPQDNTWKFYKIVQVDDKEINVYADIYTNGTRFAGILNFPKYSIKTPLYLLSNYGG